MDLNLKGKVAIVTGSTSGIGRVCARQLAAEGVNVAIVGRNEERGNKVVGECKAAGADAIFCKTDITNLADVEATVKATLDKFGKVDILVHSAAAPFLIMKLKDLPVDTWDSAVKVAQYGAMYFVKALNETMTGQRRGRIVIISSDAGRMGDAYQPVYSGAKGALIALSKSFAQDLGPAGITCNCICPALTVTEEDLPMLIEKYGYGTEEGKKKLTRVYPLRKLGMAEDVADMVVFLASDRAGHVTGQTISVSGGFTMM